MQFDTLVLLQAMGQVKTDMVDGKLQEISQRDANAEKTGRNCVEIKGEG